MSILRNFCWTWNNYPENHHQILLEFSERCVYVVYGREVGDSGTPHLQGYAELKKQTRFSTIKKLLPKIWIGSRRGTQEQAISYCKEDGDFTEIGEPRKQGERSDLDEARTLAVEGGMRAVSTTCNYQQIRTAEKYLTYNEEPRDFKPEVIWLYGPSGGGKSYLARVICKADYSEDIYTKNDATKWWEGYDGHECVIIDDFRDSWWSYTELLRILDPYECRLEFKGGYRQLRSKIIIITSIFPPTTMYAHARNEPIKQILRRIDQLAYVENRTFSLVTDVTEVGGNTRAPPIL